MKRLLIVGDRIDFSNSNITLADLENISERILETAKKQIDAGSNYLNVKVGATQEDEQKLKWLVKLIQGNFNSFPLFLDSSSEDVIRAGLEAYDNSKAKAFINSADFGDRESFIDLAAETGSSVVCVCMKNSVPVDEEERLNLCTRILDKGMSIGLKPQDMYFDPVSVSIIEEQDRIINVLETIKEINDLGLNTICGVSRVSIGVDNEIKPFIQSSYLTMAMQNGLKAAILNPLTTLLMANVIASENLLDQRLFTQGEFSSYIEKYIKELIEEYNNESSLNPVQAE